MVQLAGIELHEGWDTIFELVPDYCLWSKGQEGMLMKVTDGSKQNVIKAIIQAIQTNIPLQ